MVQVNRYYLPPTALMPNSPYPLLRYTDLDNRNAAELYDIFRGNGWTVQWIYRYGSTQRSHYYSGVHECMAVLSGTATIRFGVADTSTDMDDNTGGFAKEDGGIEIRARAGDVSVPPAGTAHKTYNAKPEAEFALLTPGDAHSIASSDVRAALADLNLSGFTMIGAYPTKGNPWDSMKGGELTGSFEQVWSVPMPDRNPFLGRSREGLCGHW